VKPTVLLRDNETDTGRVSDTMNSSYLGWSSTLAPTMMGNWERPELDKCRRAASVGPTR